MKKLILAALLVFVARPVCAQTRLDIDSIRLGSTPCVLLIGSGSPESSVSGSVCDTYWRVDTGDVYTKTSGTATTTGWSIVYRAGGTDVSVGDGGTGVSTFTSNGVLFGNGSSAIQVTSGGPANSVLTANGGAPSFSSTPTVSNLYTTGNSGIGTSTPGTVNGLDLSSQRVLHVFSSTASRVSVTGTDSVIDLIDSDASAGTKWATIVSTGGTFRIRSLDDSGNAVATLINADLGASGNLALSPGGDITVNPTGNDVLPYENYDINLGALSKKYLMLHAAELWVETLVAQNTIATIGGRVLVAPTTPLSADLAAGGTTITVKYNNLSNGDRIYLEADGKVEFMAVTSSAGGGAGAYTYSVTRNLDGSGANDWYAGDAALNTGTTGNGFIDLYSVRGVKSASEAGPTIVGNVRLSATYNDWAPRWAIGNLNGLYGYGVTTYGAAFGDAAGPNITIDATNGVRIRSGTTNKLTADTGGNLNLVGDLVLGTASVLRAVATGYSTGNGFWLDYNGGTPRFRVGVPGGAGVFWDGSTLSVSGSITVTGGNAETTTGAQTKANTAESNANSYTNTGLSGKISNGGAATDVNNNVTTISGGKITTGSIAADRISTATLSAITSTLGTVTVGTSGYVRQGQTDYNTGTGWWIGDVSGTPKFSIGNASGNRLSWDGTTLTVVTDYVTMDNNGIHVNVPSTALIANYGYDFRTGFSGTTFNGLYAFESDSSHRALYLYNATNQNSKTITVSTIAGDLYNGTAASIELTANTGANTNTISTVSKNATTITAGSGTPLTATFNTNLTLATAADSPLTVNYTGGNGANTQILFLRGGNLQGSITSTASTTAYNTSSDARLKTNIRPTVMGLTELLRINVRDFTMRTDPAQRSHTGFIAQELQQVYPDAVFVPDMPTDPWQVDYGRLTPLLVRAVQELTERVRVLESKSGGRQ